MENLSKFFMAKQYKKVNILRSDLDEINKFVDWKKIRNIFPHKQYITGRPPYDEIVMIKTLLLQNMHGLSDEEIEFQINDRLSFQNFLDFPNTIPDFTTIWRFRDELLSLNIEDKIFDEFYRQIKQNCIEIEKGSIKDVKIKKTKIQDAIFIHAEPGKKNSGIDDRQMAKTNRSRDGSWTKKNKKSIFGFKLHTKIDEKEKLIEEVALTTAKTHDGNIDLAEENEIIYRDKGYSGVKTRAKGDGTMKKGKLSVKQKLRNKRISKRRTRVEHPYGMIVRKFKGGFTRLTTLSRVYVQQLFVCINYNLQRGMFLKKSCLKI